MMFAGLLGLELMPFKRDKVPNDFASLEALHASLETLMRDAFKGRQGAPVRPVFMVVWERFKNLGPTLGVVPCAWDDDDEKDAFLASIWALFQEIPPQRYAMSSEVWMAEQKTKPKPSDPLPRDRPDRQECLIVAAAERGGHNKVALFSIQHEGDLRTLAGDPLPGPSTQYGGRMLELMEA